MWIKRNSNTPLRRNAMPQYRRQIGNRGNVVQLCYIRAVHSSSLRVAAHAVLNVVVYACPELSRRDEVQLLVREPVVRRQHPVDFVEDGLGRAWVETLTLKKDSRPLLSPPKFISFDHGTNKYLAPLTFNSSAPTLANQAKTDLESARIRARDEVHEGEPTHGRSRNRINRVGNCKSLQLK